MQVSFKLCDFSLHNVSWQFTWQWNLRVFFFMSKSAKLSFNESASFNIALIVYTDDQSFTPLETLQLAVTSGLSLTPLAAYTVILNKTLLNNSNCISLTVIAPV